jgi:hypothetical protein
MLGFHGRGPQRMRYRGRVIDGIGTCRIYVMGWSRGKDGDWAVVTFWNHHTQTLCRITSKRCDTIATMPAEPGTRWDKTLIGFLHAGRLSTINKGTPYSGWGCCNSVAVSGVALATLSQEKGHRTRLRCYDKGCAEHMGLWSIRVTPFSTNGIKALVVCVLTCRLTTCRN